MYTVTLPGWGKDGSQARSQAPSTSILKMELSYFAAWQQHIISYVSNKDAPKVQTVIIEPNAGTYDVYPINEHSRLSNFGTR